MSGSALELRAETHGRQRGVRAICIFVPKLVFLISNPIRLLCEENISLRRSQGAQWRRRGELASADKPASLAARARQPSRNAPKNYSNNN